MKALMQTDILTRLREAYKEVLASMHASLGLLLIDFVRRSLRFGTDQKCAVVGQIGL